MKDLLQHFRMPDRLDVSLFYFALLTAVGLAMMLLGGIGEWKDFRRQHPKRKKTKHDD